MYQVVIQREFEHIGMYIYNISETWEYNYRQAFWQPKDKIELYVGTYTYNIFQIEKETIRSWEQQELRYVYRICRKKVSLTILQQKCTNCTSDDYDRCKTEMARFWLNSFFESETTNLLYVL